MANGPPTPPATTPAELQDAARASTSVAESSASILPHSDIQIRPEIYQRAIPTIGEAIVQKNYSKLVRIAEELEITALRNDEHQSRFLVVGPLVLGHLISDSVSPARYALQRLPDSLASLPLARALSSLVVSTLYRQHAQLFEQATALMNLVSQPDFFDKDLGLALHTLISAFLESFRQLTFELLSKAYTSLPTSLACVYLGLPADEIVNVAEKVGWSYQPSTQILCPKYGIKVGAASPSGFSSLNTFQFVADSVAQLES